MLRLIAETDADKEQIKIAMDGLYYDSAPSFLTGGILNLTDWDMVEFRYERLNYYYWGIALNKQEWDNERKQKWIEEDKDRKIKNEN